MFINYYQSYLSMIRASVWVPIRRHLRVTKENGQELDILGDGNISCAYFVSCILKTFHLTGATFANVLSLEKHLLEFGWSAYPSVDTIDDLPPWSLIIWDKQQWSIQEDIYGKTKDTNYHIGFYIGDQQAISNMSDGFYRWKEPPFAPAIHHRTYNNTRTIRSILTFRFTPSLTEYINTIHPAWLINKQLEIPFVGMTRWWLEKYNLNEEELARALWQDQDTVSQENWTSLQHGRMCGPACILSAYQYLTQKNDRTLKETIALKDQKHPWEDYFTIKTWRYHDGLIFLASSRWLQGERWEIKDDVISWLKQLVGSCIDEGKVLMCSVSPWFDQSCRGWHLVIVRWYNRNSYQEELIINDPLNEQGIPQPVTLSSFLNSWNGKYIIIEK